jgi:nitroreductase
MFLDLLRKRRSIRQYQDRPVEGEKIEQLTEAMLRAPSSRGLNPWEFVVVTDKETLESLSRAKQHGSAFAKGAPLAIVVLGDPARGDVWIEDCSIAALVIHLAAADLGLGSCWIQVRKRDHDGKTSAEDYVRGVLGVRPELQVEAIIAIGYPKEEKAGHPRATLPWEKVSHNRYGEKT